MKDVIVRVPTKRDWERVVITAISNGCLWYNDSNEIDSNEWMMFKEKSCVEILGGKMRYSPEPYYITHYQDIPIVTAQEFLEGEIEYGADKKVASDTGSSYATDKYVYPFDVKIVLDMIKNNINGETISQPNKTMNKLNPMTKRLLDKDTQTLCKAGYINGDLELTENGRNALDTIIFTANKAELVKMAQEELDEEE